MADILRVKDTIKSLGTEEETIPLEIAIETLCSVISVRDPYTAEQQQRVTDLACAIATHLCLPPVKIDRLRLASRLYEIGKISVPSEILYKPTLLTKEEYALVQTHSIAGYNILKSIDTLCPIARIVLEHHERMNGSGYPQGITGNDILIESRVLAVADVVHAITSHRPYRPSLGLEVAIEELTSSPL